ncbi:bifunctional DNA-formamidopyrimidine glycosylase/DNA-(apurinic or apyrimidinic site) lyase [Trueperella sp. LYQ143]|uniref:bifunctional DNA-formamidopyrimidine glycosylase/DNA-(apurinic or apyrimidinic site) lyase n=1 Tax=Trueperella sp. LYQ143 TaxID=3391059 RepID=UPI00398388C3
MPELPEVETIRRGLARHLIGQTIARVSVDHPRVIRSCPQGLDSLVGRRITQVARRGKYLWFVIGRDEALIAHLGMSGQFRVDAAQHRHRRAALWLDNGVRVDFIDQRTFGQLRLDRLCPTQDGYAGGCGTDYALIPESIAHIGRDLLDPYLQYPDLIAQVRAKNTEIKRLLLDQQLASGIGNIYADEALFAAQIHPQMLSSQMSPQQIAQLYAAAREVMQDAVEVGGTSFDSLYVNVNGESGYFSRTLQVYGRHGLACYRCGAQIVRQTFMNRGSHFCPNCQHLP